MTTIRYLEWDSKFFGLKICKIEVKNSSKLEIEHFINLCIDDDVKLMYLFSNQELDCDLYISHKYSIKKIDTKVVFSKEIKNLEKTINVNPFNGAPHLLYDLAYISGFDSRYKRDINFPKGSFENLYRTWIDNSVNKKIADCILVYPDSANPYGFVSIKCNKPTAEVGLIATDTTYQSKGIGTNLMKAAFNYAFTRNANIFKVATQADNIKACNFYTSLDLKEINRTYIYHIWNKII